MVRIEQLVGGVHATRTTHGGSNERLYELWNSMFKRCYTASHDSYPQYGGSGIVVCTEWEDYAVFRKWAKEHGHENGLQIDRINSSGNYEPSNCRWVTPKQNCRNRKDNRMLTAFEETKCMAEWADDARCVVRYDLLRSRICKGWDAEDAITRPVKKQRNNHV